MALGWAPVRQMFRGDPGVGTHPKAAGAIIDGIGTSNSQAAAAFQRGLFALRRGSVEGFRQAVAAFTMAVHEDPQFLEARCRLFEAYLLDEDGGIDPIANKLERLTEIAAGIHEVFPDSAASATARGILLFARDWNWTEARAQLANAVGRDPGSRFALTYQGYLLTRLGEASEARRVLLRAREVDPVSPFITKLLGHCAFLERNHPEALRFYVTASEQEPSYPSGHYWAGRVFLAMTNYPQAIDEFQQFETKRQGLRLMNSARFPSLRAGFEKHGLHGYWRRVIEWEDQVERTDGAFHTAYARAEAHARMGETELAFENLSISIARRQDGDRLLLDEFWDTYRQHPEFARLLDRAGLGKRTQPAP